MSVKETIISRPNLVEEVTSVLRKRIISGEYPVDSSIPSEGDLGKSLGVSRNVIREAMRNLSSQGLIEVSQGKRPRVKSGDSDAVINSLESFLHSNDRSLEHLTEVRFSLELEIASLAARRCNAEDLTELEKDIQLLSEAKNQKKCIEADVSFHLNMARATHNPVFVMIYTTISKMLNKLLEASYENLDLSDIVDRHLNIIDAVKSGDSDKARIAMRKHIVASEKDLKLK